MVLFENAVLRGLTLLYFAVKVCDPGARPVIKVVALAWISPVSLLPPCSRLTALGSRVALATVPASTWKLIQP